MEVGVGLGVGGALDGAGLGVGGALDGAGLALALGVALALGADDGAALPVTGIGRIGATEAVVVLPEHPANPAVPHAARNRR
jgi:hypothetical protein